MKGSASTALAALAVLALGGAAASPTRAAEAPSVRIVAPAPGATVTGSSIPVKVAASNFTVECRDIGKPGKKTQGHFHAMLDGMTMAQLTNFYCSDTFAISGEGLKPGTHMLAVTLADDAHVDLGKPAMVKFSYEPSRTAPLPQPERASAHPTVRIVSPANGASVGRTFPLVVTVDNVDLSCNLEGKPNVKGYGHLHVFVHESGVTPPSMPMSGDMAKMSMVGMIGMPCTTTVPVDLSTWKPGPATITVMLADNDHGPTTGAVPASVEVTLK